MAREDRQITITSREFAECLTVAPDTTPARADEVCGRTLVSLISTGTELNGAYQGETFPQNVGYACVFRVDEVGDRVMSVSPGDIAFAMGGHRSSQRHDESGVVKVPDGLSPEQALFARMMCVSMSTLTTTTARPPSTVLVMGLGIVGNLAAQMFRSCGYDVVACDPDAGRLDIARQMGIERVHTSVPTDDPELVDRVALPMDCSGNEQAVLDACRVVRKRGEVVLIATPWRKRTDTPAHDVLREVFHRYIVLRSGWEWEVPTHPADFRANSIYGNIAGAMGWVLEGRVSVGGLAETIAPEKAQEAYQALLTHTARRLTYIFDWRNE